MKKQDLIKQAYGEHFEEVKDWIDENGFLDSNYFTSKEDAILYHILSSKEPFEHYTEREVCRPISLKGIENNFGWIELITPADLPTNFGTINWFVGRETDSVVLVLKKDIAFYNASKIISFFSHYLPIETPKSPLENENSKN